MAAGLAVLAAYPIDGVEEDRVGREELLVLAPRKLEALADWLGDAVDKTVSLSALAAMPREWDSCGACPQKGVRDIESAAVNSAGESAQVAAAGQ